MLVTAVTRAAKDFGSPSPRDDTLLSAMMEGLRRVKGVAAKKKLAMVGTQCHVSAIMAMRRPKGRAIEGWVLTSEMIGSHCGSKADGALREGPTGLDVCDVAIDIIREDGQRWRMELKTCEVG